ncbi:PadR family transcriptional regulator, partial [Alkalihalophilus pseudofirmus]
VRLDKKKLVNIEKKSLDMAPLRKFYSLNEAGRKELELFWKKWDFVSSKINVLRST